MEESTTNKFVLPRSPWQSQVNYLRLMFKAKKALDRIEQNSVGQSPITSKLNQNDRNAGF